MKIILVGIFPVVFNNVLKPIIKLKFKIKFKVAREPIFNFLKDQAFIYLFLLQSGICSLSGKEMEMKLKGGVGAPSVCLSVYVCVSLNTIMFNGVCVY